MVESSGAKLGFARAAIILFRRISTCFVDDQVSKTGLFCTLLCNVLIFLQDELVFDTDGDNVMLLYLVIYV